VPHRGIFHACVVDASVSVSLPSLKSGMWRLVTHLSSVFLKNWLASFLCHLRILKEQRKVGNQFTTTRPQASWDHHDGQHFVLLVEPMFVLACLASLPGTPRRAFDAAGLVLAWFGVFAMAMAMQVQADKG